MFQTVAPCSSAPCLNGGSCKNLDGGTFLCSCTLEFFGQRCESEGIDHGMSIFDSHFDSKSGVKNIGEFMVSHNRLHGLISNSKYLSNSAIGYSFPKNIFA